MIISVVVLVAMAVFLLLSARSARTKSGGQKVPESTWAAAHAGADGQIGRLLLKVAKPVSSVIEISPQTRVYRSLATKLAATGGGLFAGSVEVYLSTQVATILIGALILAILPMLGLSGLPLFAAVAIAGVLAILPYNQVHEAGKKRLEQVRNELPEFAELLMMPVSSGYGILPALDFTASRTEGIVASEVRTMLALLSTRAASEAAIFESTGAKLGDPSAVTFFNTLYQSYSDGVRIADSLRSQAEALRHQEYQRTRAALKKLPNKMVFIIALHLLPFLFVVTVLPTLFAMRSMG